MRDFAEIHCTELRTEKRTHDRVKMKILVVGAGVTGSLISCLLKTSNRLKDDICLQIWEKSRGYGGRMATTRLTINSESEKSFQVSADIGAQYISVIPKYAQNIHHQRIHQDLLESGVLKSFTDMTIINERPSELGTKHFVAPEGLSKIAKHFTPSSVEVRLDTHLQSLSASQSGLITARSKDGLTGDYNLIILTQPAPQVLQIEGIDELMDPETRIALENVEYSSRFVFTVHTNTQPPVDWAARYVTPEESSCVRFISIDNRKRGCNSQGTTLVVHTSVPYGKQYLEVDKQEMGGPILAEVSKILSPWISEKDQGLTIKCHKWRYSQVSTPYSGSPGCVVANKSEEGRPRIVLAGDSYTHSNLDGCISSALSAVDRIESAFAAV